MERQGGGFQRWCVGCDVDCGRNYGEGGEELLQLYTWERAKKFVIAVLEVTRSVSVK